MTLFVICAVGVALLCAVAVVFLIRFARRRSEPGAPVPHYVVPYTPARAPARTPTPAPSTTPAPPPAPAPTERASAPPTPAAPATPALPVAEPQTPAASSARPSWEDEPYGTGSAHPLPDGSAPSAEYTVKGDPDEMRYFTVDSRDFGRVRAEVWFRTERDAQKAGFAKSSG